VLNIKKQKIAYLNAYLVVITFIINLFIITRNFKFGSEVGHFLYPYIKDLTIRPIWVFILVTPLIIIFTHFGAKYIRHYELPVLSLGFILCFILQIFIFSCLAPFSFSQIIESDFSNSFYSPTLKYSLYDFLTNYNSISKDLLLHARTNMPGKVLLFYFLKTFTNNSQILGYLIVIISNIGSLITYYITKIIFKNRYIALYSFILYFFIPAKLFFFPILNTVTPTLILFSLLLFIKYLESRKNCYLISLGFFLYWVLLFEPTPLVLGIIFVFILAKYYYQKKVQNMHLLKIIFISSMSFLLMHLLGIILLRFNIIDAFSDMYTDAVDFNIRTDRSYPIWLFQNLKEFFVNSGIAPSILFFVVLSHMITKIFQLLKNKNDCLKKNIEFLIRPGQLITFSFLATLLLVVILGVNRGEVTRLWIFLTVFIQIITAYFCGTISNKLTFYLVLSSVMSQTVFTINMVAFVIPDLRLIR